MFIGGYKKFSCEPVSIFAVNLLLCQRLAINYNKSFGKILTGPRENCLLPRISDINLFLK